MKERRNFLILAAGMGTIGIIIGAVTIWRYAAEFVP